MIGHREHDHAEWYDRGGPLPTEVGSLACELVKPEPIFTERQWEDFHRALDRKN